MNTTELRIGFQDMTFQGHFKPNRFEYIIDFEESISFCLKLLKYMPTLIFNDQICKNISSTTKNYTILSFLLQLHRQQ